VKTKKKKKKKKKKLAADLTDDELLAKVKKLADGEDDDDEEEEEEEPEEEDPGPPPPPPRPPVKVTFAIDMETNFGDHLAIVGKHPLLGEWVPSKGVPMDWVEGARSNRIDSIRRDAILLVSRWETLPRRAFPFIIPPHLTSRLASSSSSTHSAGTRWTATVYLPEFSLLQYKYVVRSGWNPNGEARWQGGPDRIVATGNHHTEQSLRDVWTDGDWGAENPTCKALNAAMGAFDEARPMHRSPYDPVRDVNVDP
jgi:hypothetical protein